MKLYVGLTDQGGYEHLAGMSLPPDKTNFCLSSGASTFKAIQPGAPSLFKLHNPNNVIRGSAQLIVHHARG